ncbi:UBX domain-containing protein 2A isoform X3 [Nerophis ophidion]|uniref:UBX domain-containing protein 2A isoform X3 n=1 Tax=Nerophis ophidion TaxID=159077 RepID=UPI002AE001FB|nr:UBX domain-containing protein 2A isoform X3 [Nerophis ophidion]
MIHNDVENDDNWVASDDDEEEAPMRCSFSVEDLLDEVEKVCYDASGTSKVEMVVRLWKDGFTVNDQEFRSYSVPENQQFLDAIKRGELPAEWESRAEEEELEVNVEDLTEEAYVPKKKVFHPFSGRGYRLGSVAPRVVARSPSVHEDGESPPIPMVTLNHALPVTSLQIWLADGRRLVQRFNLSHRPSIHPSLGPRGALVLISATIGQKAVYTLDKSPSHRRCMSLAGGGNRSTRREPTQSRRTCKLHT